MSASPVDAPFAPERAARRTGNNFGVTRLCLAGLVIFGHAPELIDGDQRREIVHRLTGQGSVGAAAVTGFFLLSGFLITQSMMSTGAVGPYLLKRVLRIVPGFVVAYVLTVFLLAPALGARIAGQWWPAFRNLMFLHEPPRFFGAVEPHYRTINGALWTISFEFRCYLLIAALWLVGVLQRPRLLALVTLIVIGASVVAELPAVAARIDRLATREAVDLIVGKPSRLVDFAAVFLIGACLFQFRTQVMPRLSGWAALAGAVLMLPALAIFVVGSQLFTLLFATVLFWIALKPILVRGNASINIGT